jgi:hypothetical protein
MPQVLYSDDEKRARRALFDTLLDDEAEACAKIADEIGRADCSDYGEAAAERIVSAIRARIKAREKTAA